MKIESKVVTTQELLKGYETRRHEQANLPIEEKVAILIKLQTINAQIAKQKGRPVHEPWKTQKTTTKSVTEAG